MKKLLLMLVVIVGLSIWIIFSPPQDGGYLLIMLGGKTIEMSLWFAALIILALMFVIWLVLRIFRGSVSVAQRFSDYVNFGGSERAQKRTLNGLVDYIEGNWLQARKQLLRAAPKVEAPLINYLAAARSAFEMGDQTEATRLLKLATDTVPDSELAVALTQARMELLNKDYDQCLATLMRVKPKAPQNPVLLDLLRQVYLAREDWDGLLRIFERLRSYKIDTPQALEQLEVKIHSELLKKEGALCQRVLQTERLPRLRAAWNKLPGNMQKHPDVIAAYARQLALCSEDQEAELLLRKALSKQVHPEMVYIYGRVRGSDIRLQLRVVEDLHVQHPRDAQLLFCLGRLSMRNQLWGKARDCFRDSLSIRHDPEICAELARLLENMGEHQKSMDYYQMGLGLTTNALPELPLPKKL
jgi:HemY protein